MLGSYNPKMDRIELNAERIKHWIGNGATVSDTVHNLLVTKKIIDGKKINVLPKKTVEKKDEPVVESAPAAEAPAESESVDTPVATDTPEA